MVEVCTLQPRRTTNLGNVNEESLTTRHAGRERRGPHLCFGALTLQPPRYHFLPSSPAGEAPSECANYGPKEWLNGSIY